MKPQTAEYQEQSIRYYALPNNDLLLNSIDVYRILDVAERPADKYLDLAGAIEVAYDADDEDFAEWLQDTFIEYNLQTLVRPGG